MRIAVIPSEARSPSSIKTLRKERFLTSQTPFGMTNSGFFSKLLKNLREERESEEQARSRAITSTHMSCGYMMGVRRRVLS